MELLNATKMQAGYTQGLRPDGRELLVVVVKGTFTLPRIGEAPTLADEQLPLIESDAFTGEPGQSAPRYESDYAPFKPRCDVILNGSAYAPQGKPASKVPVGLKVGRVAKVFNVLGDRTWEAGLGGIGPGVAVPFTRKAITYDVAFGGVDRFSEDPAKHDAFLPNPCGRGFRKGLTTGPIDGTPMPNTEERDDPVKSPLGRYRPMSFGPVGRSWEPRCKLAGTYDEPWLENVFPFLPADFDDRYYQCAPDDQQTEPLVGGETVTLVNLTPDGRRTFELPRLGVPVHFFLANGVRKDVNATADTLYLEPDENRFAVVWRAHLPLMRNLFEVEQVLTGDKSAAWWRARELGKNYYPSLGAAVRAARQAEEESPA
jgi:hypothetical protein